MGRKAKIKKERQRKSFLQLLPPETLDIYPCAMFLNEFTKEELEKAVREYLNIHDFKGPNSAQLQPKGLAKNLDFCQGDFPADMANAMSLNSFSSWLENKPLNESSARRFCQTVCSIAQGMYYINLYSKQVFEKIEDVFEVAIEIQYALYPKAKRLSEPIANK